MEENKPWESEAFTDFLNDVNQLATDKYGWNVAGHKFDDEEWLELFFAPAIGSDALNKKF